MPRFSSEEFAKAEQERKRARARVRNNSDASLLDAIDREATLIRLETVASRPLPGETESDYRKRVGLPSEGKS